MGDPVLFFPSSPEHGTAPHRADTALKLFAGWRAPRLSGTGAAPWLLGAVRAFRCERERGGEPPGRGSGGARQLATIAKRALRTQVCWAAGTAPRVATPPSLELSGAPSQLVHLQCGRKTGATVHWSEALGSSRGGSNGQRSAPAPALTDPG